MMNLPNDFRFKGLPANLRMEDQWVVSRFNQLAKDADSAQTGVKHRDQPIRTRHIPTFFPIFSYYTTFPDKLQFHCDPCTDFI